MRSVSQSVIFCLAFLSAVQSTACRSSEPVPDSVVVRDSAGIRIVENVTPVSPPGTWAVSTEPILEIGANKNDAMHDLYRIVGSVVLSDGRVVVVHNPAPMVRWFAPDGAFLTGAGRPGGGPGEFGTGESAWIHAMWPIEGDSIATWEHSARRMQVFDPEGKFIRSVVIELPPEMPVGTYPQIAGRSPAGFVAFLVPESEIEQIGEKRRDNFTYLTYAADGAFKQQLAILPGFERVAVEVQRPGRSDRFRVWGSFPFSKPPVSWLHGNRFYYGSADRYEIAIYELDGTLTHLIRRTVPNEAVTPEIISAHKEQRLAALPAAGRTTNERQALADLQYPESFPAYRRIRVDREGLLWVQRYDLPGDTTVTWSVFDREGRWTTDVSVPKAWQIHDIGSDYILAVMRDELDVERVRRFRLSRGS